MDFESLLHVARKNQLQQKGPTKCLQTKFKPPTKEQREKARSLSEGVQKFLARKELEEKVKKDEDKKRLAQLTALRAQDPKANRRIQHMLKRTKSANKSVMEDVDETNTADTIAGPSQPDEDDYGFVSETSSALYNKLIQKMYSTPTQDEVKFAPSKKPSGTGSLSNTKERVKMALIKQEEEERLPHKRKRKKHDGDEKDDPSPPDACTAAPVEEKPEKPKPKRAAPPPMDFIELLKLAEKKQFEPIQIVNPKAKPSEPEQLMTKKQREEQRILEERRREREERQRQNAARPAATTVISKPTKPVNVTKPPSATQSKVPTTAISKVKDIRPSKASTASSKSKEVPQKKIESETDKLRRERDEVLRVLKEKEEAMKLLEEKERLIKERDEALAKLRLMETKESQLTKKTAVKSQSEVKKVSLPNVSPVKSATREFPPKDVRRPPPPSKPSTNNPQSKVNGMKKPLNKRRIEDSDEYDSEMDDFIDDGPEGTYPREDVSQVISQIFRYDRNKYSGRDEGPDECMESNWSQITKEEYYSARCGLLEDLEDIKAEKEALARKKKKR